jgi:hypothetical protein
MERTEKISTADSYRLTVNGTTHSDFTNLHLVSRFKLFKITKQIVSIAPEKIFEIMELYLLRFFDRYIKKVSDSILPENKYQEIDYDFLIK